MQQQMGAVPPIPAPSIPTPAPQAQGFPIMSTPPPPPPPTMADGGEMDGGSDMKKSNPFKEFFADLNMVEIGILALGVASFLYAINYYKFEMKMTKTGYADLNGRMTKLESAEQSRQMKEANANANGMSRRSKRRLMI